MAAYSKPFVRTQALSIDGVEVTATAAELNAMDGILATSAELNRAADVSTRVITLVADATIAEATHEGKILLLGEVGGNAALAATLPAATGSGAKYKFVVSVVNTSGYTIQVTTTDVMQGNIATNSTGDDPDLLSVWPAASDSDTIILNGTTTGGVSIGDFVECVDILAGTWVVYGVATASGAEATPFSAAVGA